MSNNMTGEVKVTAGRQTTAEEVVEMTLLLPAVVFSALEAEAGRRELTIARLLRVAVSDFLRRPPGERPGATGL